MYFVNVKKKVSCSSFSNPFVQTFCCRSWCLCFDRAGRLALALVPCWLTQATHRSCLQLQVLSKNLIFPKKEQLFLPLIGPLSVAPSQHNKPLPACLQPIREAVTPPSCRVANEFQPGAHLSLTILFFCLVWFRVKSLIILVFYFSMFWVVSQT